MRTRDTGLHYGLVTITCHWIGAVLMLAFITATFVASDAAGRDLAMGLGLLTAPLYAFRLYWRLTNYNPAPLGGTNPAQVLVGQGVVLGMLLAGVVLPILFWAKEAGGGAQVHAFTLPLPSYAAEPWSLLTPLFWLGVTAFLLGFGLHLFGVYTHQFVLKDETLNRLLGKAVKL